jgi:hypothetical protein
MILRYRTVDIEMDKWNILRRLRRAFEEIFGAARLSHRESEQARVTWY